jgi:hypothetical protein
MGRSARFSLVLVAEKSGSGDIGFGDTEKPANEIVPYLDWKIQREVVAELQGGQLSGFGADFHEARARYSPYDFLRVGKEK